MATNYGRRTVVFFEIDQPFCSLTYGESPCGAVLGVTGTRKCYNTLATCQDSGNFTPGTLQLRFARDDDRLALEHGPVIACLEEITTTPGRINLAGMEDNSSPFGSRESVSVQLRDFQWSDLHVDKYRLERTFVAGQKSAGYQIPAQAFPTFGARARTMPESDIAVGEFFGYDDPARAPFKRGTFWSRWLARNPYYTTMSCRVREGYAGDALENMRVRNYVLERIEGPVDGVVTITATDVFSRIEARKALAPHVSIGDLTADLTGSPATFSVTSGTGALTPAEGGYSTITGVTQGWVAIGRKEIIKVTRSGDVFTVVSRGQLGTLQQDHRQGDSVQLVLAFVAQLSHDIAYTLTTGYTTVSSALINKPGWDVLAASVTELFTAYIAEPTPVQDLLGELMVQAGFTIWPDVRTGMISYAALRSGAVSPSVTDRGWIVDGSFSHKRRTDQRVSQSIVYYRMRNPIIQLSDETNFGARVITPGPGASPYGTESLRKIYSRWITVGGQNTAVKCGNRIFAMYGDPPLEARFRTDALRAGELAEGSYFSLEAAEIQDDVGDVKPTAMAPVSIRRGENMEEVEAKSVRFSEAAEDGVRRIFIDSDEYNLNLRTLHDLQYPAPVGDEVIQFIIQAGITIGSTSTSTKALRTGDWPAGVSLSMDIHGRLRGKGGRGGNGSTAISDLNGGAGENGGDALEATYPITIDNADGKIWAGGGAGGAGGSGYSTFGLSVVYAQAGGAGGGAGIDPGLGGTRSTVTVPPPGGVGSGTYTGVDGNAAGDVAGGAGGAGGSGSGIAAGTGGTGGAPGMDGTAGAACTGGNAGNGAGGAAGAKGNYIVGNSFVTWTSLGDVRGGVA